MNRLVYFFLPRLWACRTKWWSSIFCVSPQQDSFTHSLFYSRQVFHLSCFPRRFLVQLQLMRWTHTTSLTAGGGEAGDTVLAGLRPGPHWPLHWHLGVFCWRRALGLLERSLPVNMERWKGLGIQTPLGGCSTKLPSPWLGPSEVWPILWIVPKLLTFFLPPPWTLISYLCLAAFPVPLMVSSGNTS